MDLRVSRSCFATTRVSCLAAKGEQAGEQAALLRNSNDGYNDDLHLQVMQHISHWQVVTP